MYVAPLDGSRQDRRSRTALGRFVVQLAGRARAVRRGYGAGTLDEGVVVVQKDSTPDGVDIWVGAVLHDVEVDELTVPVTVGSDSSARKLSVTLRWYKLDEGPVRGVPAGARFFHNHLTIDDLALGQSYPVTVEVEQLAAGGRGTATCIARTLPGDLREGRPLRVFAASCYDAGTDPDDKLDAAFRCAFPAPAIPDLTLLLGDQVYADAPISHYLLRSRRNPRAGLLLKYWTAWGMSTTKRRVGLQGVLKSGPNYFLPDDHEFWNNWPNQSVTAKHSYRNILAALRNGRVRSRSVVPDTALPAVTPPPNPLRAPTDPYQQNYLPVHPAEWEKWSLASFELFGSFQTRSLPDRAGRPSLGTDDETVLADLPALTTTSRIHAPRNAVVQVATVGPITFCLLDTRTRRTRRLRHPYHSGFVDREFLDEVLGHARDASVFVLATPQPLLARAAWLDKRTKREKASMFGDASMQDYWHQWERLWAGLVEARDNRPTITVGGDIHQSYVAVAKELNLVEVVASPMSLVWGGNMQRRLLRLFRMHKLDFTPGNEFIRLSDVVAGPDGIAGNYTTGAVSTGCLPVNRPSFSSLTFERIDGNTVSFDVKLFDRDALADQRDAEVPPVSASYALRLDARGPGAISVAECPADSARTLPQGG
jgi:hypothetical protein